MIIITNMIPNHLIECGDSQPNPFHRLIQSRPRSERASSLALPNNSLLDLYDIEQEQCNSIALLPFNINVAIRRHSSHCYQMSDDHDKSFSLTSRDLAQEDRNHKLDLTLKNVTHTTLNHPITVKVIDQNNTSCNIYPPPIPKRTFRGKLSWNTDREDTSSKQIAQNKNQTSNAKNNQIKNFQPNRTNSFCPLNSSSNSTHNLPPNENGIESSQYHIYNAASPNEQFSDDDRMSLENSVFDESLTSPFKSLLPICDSFIKPLELNICSCSTTPSIKSGGEPTSINYFDCDAPNNVCRLKCNIPQADRSSGESNKSQATSDTGYISSTGSDRNTTDFRSRFSSVDTQSSLDSCLTEKTNDSPLSKDSFKIDSSNETPTQSCNEFGAIITSYQKKNSVYALKANSGPGGVRPEVPLRKQFSATPKMLPPVPQTKSSNLTNTVSVTTSARPKPPTPPSRSHLHMNGDITNKSLNSNNSPDESSLKVIRKHRPPPIVYPKLHQPQDSYLLNESSSINPNSRYNQKDASIQGSSPNANSKKKNFQNQSSNDSLGKIVAASRYMNLRQTKVDFRQDSSFSSDSVSQTSSPGYNSKIIEAPLLPPMRRLCEVSTKQLFKNDTTQELEQTVPTSPITKSISTPASLQTIVRFQNGTSNMSLQHRIINRRKSSNPYVTNGRLRFRLFQILINAFALLAIAGGLAAYFSAYPTIKFVNKTIINTIRVEEVSQFGKNPAPGTCLPIIVKFCKGPLIPYNYTVFPNYIGHFGQLETQDLDAYDALVDVRCYELVSLFLCTLFVPKCGSTGSTVPPCRTLCTETMRRCGFFFDVFGLNLPEYLNCNLFKDFDNSDECVGLHQVRDVMIAARNPVCSGFLCDQTRCIPNEYVCDGHLDCMDQTDESKCDRCDSGSIYCGEDKCMSSKKICDGIIDCPYGQDERNCIRLSERNGDLGKGVLEVFRFSSHKWTPACVKNWDRSVSPTAVCSMLGYNSVNATSVVTQKTHRPLLTSVNVSTDIWKMYSKKRANLMQEFSSCTPEEDFPIAELTCANFECGKVRRDKKPARRIIGGAAASPGAWPFLAAILGGPEKIFYCAGVLIADEWVLTASHCIGNHTLIHLDDWTIQLGVTRRNSFTYSGLNVKVKTVIPHPLYNTQIAHDNDIALFQLSSRVSFHEHLLPVCLPPPELKQIKPGEFCTVIGWGKREDKNPKATYEPIVNEVQVQVIRRQQCDEWLDNLTVSDGMICAGFEEGGKDACQGDSGGPLLCPYPGEKGKWFVGGIVSWGIMCAHPKLPGVYSNVIKYIPWILEEMQKYSKPNKPAEARGINRSSNNVSGYGNRSPTDIDYYNSYEKP
ncbi:uncharacterized protein LOC129917171 isoform X2 [Episyrphus balteatus]|uniref:uncharacterized protein LOC129917171 isoform X2 n=1 Tax=Episyrphus balteatus TaxID=286459 RepID=UPI002486CDAC|nr:uncharacterized protein LOC129917171 isoform X2 [Episyrphus balteatus]